MYLSQLTLNPRHPLVVRALSDLYAMHRLLWQALPDMPTRTGEDQQAGTPHPLLYRVEPISHDGLVRVLAQSPVEPDWYKLPDASRLLCQVQQRPYAPGIETGQWLRYRLRANPVKNVRTEDEKRGARQGLLTETEQARWLVRQGERLGFILPAWEDTEGNRHPDIRIISPGIVKGYKEREEPEEPHQAFVAQTRDRLSISLLCVDYEGLMRVTEPQKLQRALHQGIGPAKGLGFGLLSIARAFV